LVSLKLSDGAVFASVWTQQVSHFSKRGFVLENIRFYWWCKHTCSFQKQWVFLMFARHGYCIVLTTFWQRVTHWSSRMQRSDFAKSIKVRCNH